jgi:thiol-disulfide isomerase/thioredoxin
MEFISKEVIENAMTYPKYVQEVKILLTQGKTSTQGDNNSTELIHYTELNIQRMHRLDKTTALTEATIDILKKVNKKLIWLDITEGWCGDAAQIVPVIEKMAQQNPNIEHRLIFRDEHSDIMDNFTTEGSRSIPMIVCLDENYKVLFGWGPRPKALHEMVLKEKRVLILLPKEERKAYFDKVKTGVQMWYNADKTVSIQNEFLEILSPFVV